MAAVARPRPAVHALAPLELALGMVLGTGKAPPAPGVPRDPVAALEAAMLPALRRGPCLVSFSGGRDSSAVLAVATGLARREGLPDPVPATIRATGAPAADESRWQELVVAHLGLHDWLRVEVADELDVCGPVARAALRRHGLLWPCNAHFHAPLLEEARGGSLLTGIGGDELFGAATSRRAAAVLAGRVRPVPRDARRVALHLAPRPLRRRWHRRGDLGAFPWLTERGRREAGRAMAAWEAAEPRGLAARMRHVRASRYLAVGTAALARLADDAGAHLAHPLLDPAVWGAVARAAPRGGHLGRADGMRAVLGGRLPPELLARPDKAGFDEVFFRRPSRDFAAAWTGAGVPEDLVDAAALRRHWLGPAPLAQSFTLLQAACLASAPEDLEQAAASLAERLPAARAAQPQHGQ